MTIKIKLAVIIVSLSFGSCKDAAEKNSLADPCSRFPCVQGAIVRGDTSQKKLTLVFTGDEFADGGAHILDVLKKQQVKGAFFFTGNFYRNPAYGQLINELAAHGHYLGAHSDRHLLYCAWENRDSLLVSRDEFTKDLEANYSEMKRFDIERDQARFFLPPYEWYNDSISAWTNAMDLQLINFSSGTRSHADYTTPDLLHYQSSDVIYKSIVDFEAGNGSGLNGFILLSHIGTAPEREDKFYLRLEELIVYLKGKGYEFVPIEQLLGG